MLCVYGSPLNLYAGATHPLTAAASLSEVFRGSPSSSPVSTNEQLSAVAAEQMLPLLAGQELHQGVWVHLCAERERT